MVKFLLKIYNLSYGTNEQYHFKENNKLIWFICVVVAVMIRFLFYYYMKIRYFLGVEPLVNSTINHDIIVSLTTFPARIENVWMVVESICRQKMRPASINLYLSVLEFPNKECDLPTNLEKYLKYGLNIVWCDQNLKPHNKYFCALKDNPDKYVITIDDDVFYRDDMISRLWKMGQGTETAVCANRVTPILSSDFKIEEYILWGKEGNAKPGTSYNYLALGTGGVLYPPGILRNSEVFDTECIINNCLKADDLWLKCHEIINMIPVKTGAYYSQSIEILGSQKISLRSTNCDEKQVSGNDIQWQNLDRVYHVNAKLKELVC